MIRNSYFSGVVWESNLLKKIPHPNPKIELGNLLEVATEIALKKMGISYNDLTDKHDEGRVPDFETPSIVIECKNYAGSVKGRYRVGNCKYQSQIRPRFTYAGCKFKILIQPEGVKWDY